MISNSINDPSQIKNIFHSKCPIKYNICSLVIDIGSCVNVASTALVDFLKIPTSKHVIPYMLQWLRDFV